MYDVAVVGGGIVGLATAHELLQRKPTASVVVLEKENTLAAHQTGHNSGVIHSGIYYEPGSLKARICRAGIRKLTEFCEVNDVSYDLCGKVIVATNEHERARLHALYERGRANGVSGLELLSPGALKNIEPHAEGILALLSPETGIVDYRDVAEKLGERIGHSGGTIRRSALVTGLERRSGSTIVLSNAGDVEARRVVCCAGLQADRVAKFSDGAKKLLIVPFRGEYYRLKPHRRCLVKNLIYPVPDPRFPFLGVHFTRRVDGEIEAGPNAVLAFAREGYRKLDVDWRDVGEMLRFAGFWRMGIKHWTRAALEYYRSLSKGAFVRGLQRLVPEITGDDLEVGGTGVRAMALEPDGNLVDDFRVERIDDVVHVLNAPSPAATSSLAIAEHVVSFLDEDLC